MWLAFCEADDPVAPWIVSGLQRRGLTPWVPITPEALVVSRRLVHEVSGRTVRTRFTLPDGRTIDSADVSGAINRLGRLPLELLTRASTSDGWYAGQEMQAVVVSVLAGLQQRAVNPPVPPGLCGLELPFAQVCVLAGRAGLAVPPLALGPGATCDQPVLVTRGTCVVLDEAVFGACLPTAVASACVQLAFRLGTRLLTVAFARGADDDTWIFAGASPRGDVRVGGEALLDALATTLREARS